MPNSIRPSRPNLGRDSVPAASLGEPAGGQSEQTLEPQPAGDGRPGATGALKTGRPAAPARGGITSMVRGHGAPRVIAQAEGASVLESFPIRTSRSPALRNPESSGASRTVERTTQPADKLKAEDYLTGLAILLCLALGIWG